MSNLLARTADALLEQTGGETTDDTKASGNVKTAAGSCKVIEVAYHLLVGVVG